MITHTPRPWVLSDSVAGLIVQLDLKSSCKPRHIANVIFEDDPEHAMGNAFLVAAAPELLKALKDLVEWVDGRAKEEEFDLPDEQTNALIAISRAKGELSLQIYSIWNLRSSRSKSVLACGFSEDDAFSNWVRHYGDEEEKDRVLIPLGFSSVLVQRHDQSSYPIKFDLFRDEDMISVAL